MMENPGDKNDNIENMPLADLLGMAGDTEDGRVQERDDEPGSGIAKLAQMVATTSIESAKKPSIAPPISASPSNPPGGIPAPASVPPGSMPPLQGSVPPGGMVSPTASVPPGGMPPTGSMPPGNMAQVSQNPSFAPASMPGQGQVPTEAMPAMQQGYGAAAGTMSAGMAQQPAMGGYAGTYGSGTVDDTDLPPRRSKTGLVIGIGVGVVALAGTVVFLVSGQAKTDTPAEDTQVAALQAKLDVLAQKQAAPAAAPTAATPEPTAAADEKPAEAAASATPEEAAVKADEEAAAEKADDAEEAEETGKPMTRAQRRKAIRAQKAVKAQKGVAGKKAAAKGQKESAASPKEEKATSKAAAELGSLLDDDVASGKKSASAGVPATPSRADVKSAMRPIQAKASKCAKYSKGTVKLKVVVGSNGRVTSSTVVGGNAEGTAANCVAMIARTAKFPQFSSSTFSFNYPVTLK